MKRRASGKRPRPSPAVPKAIPLVIPATELRWPGGGERSVAPHRLTIEPVSISQMKDFSYEDGYETRSLWTDEGWFYLSGNTGHYTLLTSGPILYRPHGYEILDPLCLAKYPLPEGHARADDLTGHEFLAVCRFLKVHPVPVSSLLPVLGPRKSGVLQLHPVDQEQPRMVHFRIEGNPAAAALGRTVAGGLFVDDLGLWPRSSGFAWVEPDDDEPGTHLVIECAADDFRAKSAWFSRRPIRGRRAGGSGRA